MQLSELTPGQNARIISMNGIDSGVRRKLMVLGLLPHSQVSLLRSAPMGDPLQIAAQGITLSVQKALACQIEVELV